MRKFIVYETTIPAPPDDCEEWYDEGETVEILETDSLRDAVYEYGSGGEADSYPIGKQRIRWITGYSDQDFRTGAYTHRTLCFSDKVSAASTRRIGKLIAIYGS